jgi:hypothetical protein
MTVVRFPGEIDDSFRDAQNGTVAYQLITDIRNVKCGGSETEV